MGLSMVILASGSPILCQVLSPDGSASTAPNPLTDPTVKPGKMLLFDLEARFAKDVLERGGGAFADWFAEGGVTLGHGGAPKRGRFAKDVLKRGGAAFADWFAEDGVTLGNGAAPKVGRVAIAKSANWDPKVYQLTWTPTDAVMGPSGDMGYTWGHFEGHSKDANGNPMTTTGRYMTIWRKQADGQWKVVLDSGANEPVAAGDCCKLPPGEH